MNDVLTVVARPSLVLLAALIAAWTLRKQPAALRHWLFAAALALAVAQPLISRVMPALRLPVVAWSAEKAPARPAPTVETSFALDPGTAIAVQPPAGVDWPQLAYRVWVAGAVLSLAILAFGALWLTWLGARASAAGPNWQEVEEEIRAHLGIRRPVRTLITSHPALLVTWGALSPVILLPADAGDWPPERIRLVLAHEMAHLARRDWLIQLLAETARAINWFNPLFWAACARLRRESEYACDDIVLDLGVGGTSYASHLVDLARTFSVHGRTWLPAPSIARPSTLERRVRAMLNPQVDRRPVSRLRRAALAAILLAIALPIAAASQAVSSPAGTVSDPHGKPLVDATLRLTSTNGGEPVETRTDDTGNFRFPQVPAGEYMLSVRYPGFSSSRQRMQLSSGGTTIELKVQVGNLSERVTVDGSNGGTTGPRTVSRAPSPSAPACTPSSTGGQITPPMKIRDVRPRYRQELVDARVQGVILMNARIGTDGRVRNVDVISPVNADLEDEALAAVSQWEFTPTYLNCEPVEVQMYVTMQFKLDQ